MNNENLNTLCNKIFCLIEVEKNDVDTNLMALMRSLLFYSNLRETPNTPYTEFQKKIIICLNTLKENINNEQN